MKETFYFTHDFNAHDDSKIRAMMRKHGLEGFGIYWYLIELLASETGKWYLEKDYEGIAFELRTQCDRIKSVIEDFNLFEFDEDNFWNNRLDKHFDERAKKSESAKKNAEARWAKQARRKGLNAVASNPHCESDAIKERKEKEKKELEVIRDFWNGKDEVKPLITTKRQSNPSCKVGQPIMMTCKKITSDMEIAYKKILKDYTPDDIRDAIEQYAIEIVKRSDDTSEGGYCKHRWSLYDFLNQGNAFKKYVNKSDDL